MGEGGSPGPRLGETAEKGEPNSVIIVQDFIPFALAFFSPTFFSLFLHLYVISRLAGIFGPGGLGVAPSLG